MSHICASLLACRRPEDNDTMKLLRMKRLARLLDRKITLGNNFILTLLVYCAFKPDKYIFLLMIIIHEENTKETNICKSEKILPKVTYTFSELSSEI